MMKKCGTKNENKMNYEGEMNDEIHVMIYVV
jgi:hypothetical protein